jgi:hypothetical protein
MKARPGAESPSLVDRPGVDAARDPSDVDRPRPSDGAPPGRADAAWLSWALAAVSALVAASWTYLAVAHANDRYRLDQVSGVRIALARWFDHERCTRRSSTGRMWAANPDALGRRP